MVRCLEEGYGSMLGRRVWFDAGQKSLVRWWVEGLGSIVGRRVGCLGGGIIVFIEPNSNPTPPCKCNPNYRGIIAKRLMV